MISCLSKLVMALLVMVAGLSSARAGDVLLNGDFADGKTHWHGDGDAPDTGGPLVITLQPDKWTVVYQSFSAETPQLELKITYVLSDDCTLAVKRSPDDLVPPLTGKNILEATGMENDIRNLMLPARASWMVVIVRNGRLQRETPVRLKPADDPNPRIFTTTLSEFNGRFANDDLCLTFPPGKGTVTLTKVELLAPQSSP
jgi:hypothetical protein